MLAPNFILPYAHRGLHNSRMPENSLAAFRAAADHGYGIELDIRVTRDNALVVFHDKNTFRMCGVDAHVSLTTLRELKLMRLLNTDETIPTLQEVLDVIHGRVPVMIEIKHDTASHLPMLLHQVLQGYTGPVCIKSFNPRMVHAYKKLAPNTPRGQLIQSSKGMFLFLLTAPLLHAWLRPHFLSCEISCSPLSLKIARLFHPTLACWTVQSMAEWQAVQPYFDLMVFEAFMPQADIHARPFQKEGNLP